MIVESRLVNQPLEPENPYASPFAPDAVPQEPVISQPENLQPPAGIAWFFLDGERRLRTFWRLLLYVIMIVAAQIFISIVMVVVALVAYFAFFARGGDGFSPDEFQTVVQENQIYFALPGTLLLVGITLPATLVMRRYLDRRSAASMGFRQPPAGYLISVTGGLVLGIAVMVFSCMLAYAGGAFTMVAGSPGAASLVWAVLLIFAAFFEEYVFRSYFLQNIIDAGRNGKNQLYYTITGVVISSILFWLAHSFNPGAWSTIWVGMNLFFAGVALSLCYMASQNVWFPTAVHFAWNCTQGLVLGVEVSGNPMPGLIKMQRVEGPMMELLNGGEFGLEGSPLGVLASLLICAVCVVMMWVKPFQPVQHEATANGTISE